MHKLPSSKSSNLGVLFRVVFLISIASCIVYLVTWKAPDTTIEKVSDQDSIKQHLLEVIRSFGIVDTGASTSTVPSEEYIDTLAAAIAAKLSPLIIKQQKPPPQQQFSSPPLIPSSLPSMEALGTKTHTDKVYHHGYHRFYPYFLEPLRAKNSVSPINMLEIGYLHGESFEMWKLYFPRANILYMEKDAQGPESRHYHPKEAFYGDQGNVADLQRMLVEKSVEGNLDLVIDDGSHHPMHQIVSFKYLFDKALKPGGVYIIEDIEMSYWLKGETYGQSTRYGKAHPDSLINKLKDLADVVNREFSPPGQLFSSSFGAEIDSSVSSVFFAGNCVVIVKMTELEKQVFGSRQYRYPDKITPPLPGEQDTPAKEKN